MSSNLTSLVQMREPTIDAMPGGHDVLPLVRADSDHYSDDPITVELMNEDSERNLAFIDKLHDLGVSKYIGLPQLVAIGDQSSGKSSVLQAITRLPFPVDDMMCTRFATEVSLHRSHLTESPTLSFSIRVPDDCTSEYTEEHLQRMRDWVPQDLGNSHDLHETAFKRVLDEASDVILGDKKDTLFLSRAALCICRTAPTEQNLTIVDIPGLVSVSHEAHITATSLVKRYIDNPQSIILAVVQPIDRGLQEVFQLLQKIPNRESRVIGVITKADRKQQGADDWIFEHIINNKANGNPYYLAQGWFALRNRRPIEKDDSDDERDEREADFFESDEWTSLNKPTRLGIVHLRLALTKMLNDHITKSIPKLVPDIRAKLKICQKSLNSLGPVRGSESEQLNYMANLASEFSKLATYALDGHYENLPKDPEAKIRKIVQDVLDDFRERFQADFNKKVCTSRSELLDSMDRSTWADTILEEPIYKEIFDVIQENRGTEFKEKVNPSVMKMLWRNKTGIWESEATRVIENLVNSIAVAILLFFKAVCKDEDLRTNVQAWHMRYLQDACTAATREMYRILEDEKNSVWTANPNRYCSLQKLQKQHIDGLVSEVFAMTSNNDGSRAASRNKVVQWLNSNCHITAVFDAYDSLVAYYEIAMDRFVDAIGLQVVERHLLGPSGPLRIFQPQHVYSLLSEDKHLLKHLAGESEAKEKQRDELNKQKVALDEALSEAQTYGYSRY